MKALLEALEYVPAKKSRPGGWRVKATLEVEFDAENSAPTAGDEAEAFLERHVGRKPRAGVGMSIKILK